MAIEIFVTLDTFLWNWDQANTGEVWLGVQPHIAGTEALTAWINNSATGSDFSYRLITKDCDSQIPYIPVSFPGNSNLTLKLYNSVNPDAVPFKTITNNRRDGVRINNVQAFRQANVEDTSASLTHQNSTGGGIRDMTAGPFAVSYLDSVHSAFTTTGNIDQLANMLTLAFWGGKPRLLPRAAADRLNLVNLMELPGVSADFLLTNLHSLNGLMFKIGTKAQIAELAAIKRIEIIGELPDGISADIVKKTDDNVIKNFTAYFSKLAAAGIQPPNTLIKSAEINNFGNRIYVIDNLVPFSPVKTENEVWFQRRSESANIVENSRLSALSRMVVHLKNTENGDAPTETDYEKIKNLNWTVYQTFDAQLIPYRKADVIASLSPEKKAPLRLIPAKQISRLFYEEVRTACNTGQIGSLGIDIFDSAGKKLQLDLINCYQFPWDQISQEDNQIDPNTYTLLYYGVKPDSGEVTVRIKRPLFARNQIQDFILTTVQYPPPRQDNLWGLRLEAADLGQMEISGVQKATYLGEELSSSTFNTLVCSPGDGVEPAEFTRLIDRISPGLGFLKDLRFEFAQSLSRAETLVEVAYPTYKLQQNPEDTDPEQDYRNDLVNHNAISSKIKWSARPFEFLSDKGQIFAVGAVKTGTPCVEETIKQYFKVAHRFDINPKPVAQGQPANARGFFNDLFRDAGVVRSLFSELEHTYGTKVDIGELKDPGGMLRKLKSHFDVPVTLAPEIKITKHQNPANDCNISNDSALLSVTYRKSAGGNAEKAVLMFNPELLRDNLFQQEKCRAIYIESWRAIAELASAKKITIRGIFYSFELKEAAKNHALGNRNFNLSDAIKINPNSDDWKVDATARIKPICQDWMRSMTGEIANPTIEIDLPPLNGRPVGEACHVFELIFEVERMPEKISPENPNWELKRATPFRDDIEGQKIISDNNASTKTLFSDYLSSLKIRTVKLPLPETERVKSEKFKNLIGEKDISKSPDANSSWIVPREVSPPTSPEKVTAAVCPLTFLPLRRNDYLGDLTTPLVRKYFKFLGQVLELGVSGEWKDWRTAEWRIHFDRLSEHLATDNAPLNSLISELVGITVPIPPENEITLSNSCHSTGGINCSLNPEVRKIVQELNKKEQNPTPLQNIVRKWLRNRLFLNPALFDEAKAFLYTNLHGEMESQPVNKDFCQMVSQKLLYDNPAIDSPNQSNPATAVEFLTYRQGFLELLNAPQSEKWFGFLEILDDVRYDNEFQYTKFQLRSFEDVIEQIDESPDALNGRIAVMNNALNLPFGQYTAQNPQNECSFVKLASRSSLINPIHIFTDKLNFFQAKTGLDNLAINKNYSYQKMRNNFEEAAANEPTLRLALKSASFNRSERLDDYILTAAFVIKANEEFNQSVTQAFGTDTFYINTLRTVESAGSPDSAGVSTEVQKVFDALSQNQQTVQLDKPFELLSPQVLNFVREAIRPISNDPGIIPKNNQFCVVREQGRNFIKFTGANVAAEAALFEFFDRKPAQPDRTDKFLLLVNLQVPIWTETALGLVQERNVSKEFAAAFQQTSLLTTSEQKYQPLLTVDLPTERPDLPITLTNRTVSAAELVRLALRLNNVNLLSDMDAWRAFDLSITVFHRQQTFVRSLFIDNQQNPANGLLPIFGKSLFPLSTRYVQAGKTAEQNALITWFDSKYKDFSIDFQWSSQSNLQFFRVQNFYVHFDN